MRIASATGVFLAAVSLSAQTLSTWNGKTVGTSSGNVSSLNGKTLGTASGNYNKWNSLNVGVGITLVTSTCQQPGASGPQTTTAIDTTGATLIVVSVAATSAGGPYVVQDNKSNGNATALTQYNEAVDSSDTQFYWESPTVGSGHTFTVSTTGSTFASICVAAYKGLTGLHDSATDSGSPGTTSCSPGSITPTSGHLAVTTATIVNAGSYSIDSGYTIDDQIQVNGGVGYGNAIAHKVATGSATNPTWTTSGRTACAIAAYH